MISIRQLHRAMAESPQRAAGVRRLALSLGLTDYPRWSRDELARRVSEAAAADSLAGLAERQADAEVERAAFELERMARSTARVA